MDEIKRSDWLYRDYQTKRCTIYASIGECFAPLERKKEVEEPVMPLEPRKEKEKHAADVVTERK